MERKFERPELWKMFHDAASADGFTKADSEALIERFRAELTGSCTVMSDLPDRMRWLHYERGELMALRHHLFVMERINGLHAIVVKAIDAIDLELHIAEKQWEHPELSGAVIAPALVRKNRPSLHLIPGHRSLGVMGMAELLIALELLEGIWSGTGQKPDTVEYAYVFETGFGFSYNDIHECKRRVFKRKPSNLTNTLDAMKTALIKEHRRREAAKRDDDFTGRK